MQRRARSICTHFAVLATVLTVSACFNGTQARSPANPVPSASQASPSLDLDCGTGECPLASAPPGLFTGQLLAYATHGFTAAELSKIRAHARGRFTAVFSSEQSLRSDEPAYPITPVATLLTNAASYAAAAGQPALREQLSTGVVLSASEAALRRTGAGSTITLANGRSLPVTAVVPDQVIGGYEMATSTSVLGPAPRQPTAYLLVGGTNLKALMAAMKAQLPHRVVRVANRTANGLLSSSDTVLTQSQIKRRFGEFSLRIGSGGSLVPDRSWTSTWIRTRDIPQLGTVECNKAILPDLTAAMREITADNLGALVHSADFQYEGGCFNPRVARFSDGSSLSSHSWGIAVDINVDTNPLGATPHQDPRLVAIMAAHGFTWGGRWLRPDGAHFEWVGKALAAADSARSGSTG